MSKGGKREGAGRKKGSMDRPRKRISNEARKYGTQALETLVKNMADENGTISNAAAKTILEYGYGKAPQEIVGDPDQPISIEVLLEIVKSKNTDT